MPSTPESLLRTELQVTGENATTWGIKTNNNIELLAEAIAGTANVNVGGSGNYTLTASNYVSDEARPATLVLTGTLTGNRDVIVPTTPKHYTVLNQTSGAFTLTIRQSAGTGVAISSGSTLIVCTSTTCVEVNATPKNASVTTAKLADASVTTAKLADASVTTAKLADASVTTPKLADNIGVPVVLAEAVASASATLDISGVFNDAIYARYELELIDLVPATNDVQALLRVGTGAGPTWQAGSGAYNNALLAWATASQGYPTAISTAIALSQQPGAGNGVHSGGFYGLVRFWAPQSARIPTFNIDTVQVGTAPAVVSVRGSGIYAAATAITGLRFLFSSGNITSGSIRLIGYRK